MSRSSFVSGEDALYGSQDVRHTFLRTAEEIVQHSRKQLIAGFERDQARALEKLKKSDFDKVVAVVVQAFLKRQLGLRGLEFSARRELSILAIRSTVRRYSETLMAGEIGPVEYFDRFYVKHFIRSGLSAQAIALVDPNLHRVAKKRGEYPKLTASMEQALLQHPSPQ